MVEAVRPVLAGLRGTLYTAEDLHLTLCFLGQVEENRLPCLRSELAGALASASAVHLRVGGTGVFPTAGKERTLWAGLDLEPDQRARLLDLVRRSREAASAAGVDWNQGLAEPPLESFVPHLTLARPRAPGHVPLEFAGLRFGRAWTAEAVLLFESAGARDSRGRYPVLARWQLASG